MARFNQKQTAAPNPRKTRNFEGEVAYTQPTPEMALYVGTATSFLSSKFYEPAPKKPAKGRSGRWGYQTDPAAEMKQAVAGVVQLADKVKSPVFIGNLAVYLRNEMYLRSVSNLLVAYLAHRRQLRHELAYHMQLRADDPKEIIAMYRYLKAGADAREIPTLPNQLKKFVEIALKWRVLPDGRRPRDAYEYRKYNRGGKEDISFLDLLRLVHPAPVNADQAEVFRQVKEDNLPLIGTWETVISAAGGDPAAKRAAWESVIDGGMPYMAALRNLRNILQAGVSPAHVQKVIDLVKSPEAVAKSKQLPFRFFSAHRELQKAYSTLSGPTNFRGVLDAVEQAMYHSAGNIPGFDWIRNLSVLGAADISGSMSSPVSGMSSVNCMDVATVLTAAFAANATTSTIGAFGDRWVPVAPSSRILKTVEDLLHSGAGWSTNGHLVIEWALKNKAYFDMVVFFTDMQLWSRGGYGMDRSAFERSWNEYKAKISPNARLVLFNLNGYQTAPIDVVRHDVLEITGWSEKIFQVLNALEKGENFFARFHEPLAIA